MVISGPTSTRMCDMCDINLDSKTLLDEHNDIEHSRMEDNCHTCGKFVNSKTEMMQHIISDHTEMDQISEDPVRTHIAPDGDWLGETQDFLDDILGEVENFPIDNPGDKCDDFFNDFVVTAKQIDSEIEKLRETLNSQESDDDDYQESNVQKGTALELLRNSPTSADGKFQCEVCGKKCETLYHLTTHRNNEHKLEEKGTDNATGHTENNLNILEQIKGTFADSEHDEDEELPLQFSERFYPKTVDEPTQITYKSIKKSLRFGSATKNLLDIMKKNANLKADNINVRVLDNRKKAEGTEVTVEVTDKNKKANVSIKIWGPREDGRKNNCTVQISKISEEANVELVNILAKKIIKPLLDLLITNVDYKHLLKESSNNTKGQSHKPPITLKKSALAPKSSNSTLECEQCEFTAKTKYYLNKHKKEMHTVSKFTCTNCDLTLVNQTALAAHVETQHCKTNTKPLELYDMETEADIEIEDTITQQNQ